MARENFLRNVSLFSGLEPNDLQMIAEICSEEAFATNDILIQQGDIGSSLYIIIQGTVRIEKLTDLNETINVAILGPGDFFGEMTVLDRFPRSASIIAMENTKCLILKSSDFLPLLELRPRISLNLLPVVVKRFRETNEQLLHFSNRLEQVEQVAEPDAPANPDINEEDIRHLLVQIMNLALRCWLQSTGKTKVDLAQESEIWTASMDSYGTFSTRTLDRYLNINKLPQHPRWNNVLRTAYFAIQNCPETTSELRTELEEKIERLESLQSEMLH